MKVTDSLWLTIDGEIGHETATYKNRLKVVYVVHITNSKNHSMCKTETVYSETDF